MFSVERKMSVFDRRSVQFPAWKWWSCIKIKRKSLLPLSHQWHDLEASREKEVWKAKTTLTWLFEIRAKTFGKILARDRLVNIVILPNVSVFVPASSDWRTIKQNAQKELRFPQKKRKRRQEYCDYFENCFTIGMRLARFEYVGFSKEAKQSQGNFTRPQKNGHSPCEDHGYTYNWISIQKSYFPKMARELIFKKNTWQSLFPNYRRVPQHHPHLLLQHLHHKILFLTSKHRGTKRSGNMSAELRRNKLQESAKT